LNPHAPTEYDIALEKTPAPQPGLPLEVELLEALREAGCTIPNGPAVLTAIQPILSRIGDAFAAEALLMIVSRLKGKKGEQIKISLLGTMDTSLSKTAAKYGISKQTLFINIQRLRARIFGKTSDGTATCRD
jgi:hypothetical protein